jgi:periplasmic copper chaperone A
MKRTLRVACLVGWSLVALQVVAEVTVAEPWARSTVKEQAATGMFMTLTSKEDAKLVGASSPAARIVEVHEMSMANNIMQMREIKAIALPAGKPVQFKPGGYHVMLIDLARPLEPGQKIPVTLVIEGKDGKRSTVAVQAEVRPHVGMPGTH